MNEEMKEALLVLPESSVGRGDGCYEGFSMSGLNAEHGGNLTEEILEALESAGLAESSDVASAGGWWVYWRRTKAGDEVARALAVERGILSLPRWRDRLERARLERWEEWRREQHR